MKLRLQAAPERTFIKETSDLLSALIKKIPSMTPEQVNDLDWALYDAGLGPKPRSFRDGSPDMTRNS